MKNIQNQQLQRILFKCRLQTEEEERRTARFGIVFFEVQIKSQRNVKRVFFLNLYCQPETCLFLPFAVTSPQQLIFNITVLL